MELQGQKRKSRGRDEKTEKKAGSPRTGKNNTRDRCREMGYREVKTYFAGAKKEEIPQGILIYGDEYLLGQALREVAQALLPNGTKDLNFETVYDDDIPRAMEQVNTYSFLEEDKVICLMDTAILHSKTDEGRFLEKAASLYKEDDPLESARAFMKYLGMLGISPKDIATDQDIKEQFKIGDDGKEIGWLRHLIQYCIKQDFKPASGAVAKDMLIRGLEKGFPKGNRLLITAQAVDKRMNLFKSIKETCLVIDCQVPKTTRKKDQELQEEILRTRMQEILGPRGKKMHPRAFYAMISRTGFDIRAFVKNLEKLADYAGEREEITEKDVTSLLARTRQDPVYELTGAVFDKNPQKSLFFLDSLLSGGYAHLQVLSALINHLRKLILIKSFVQIHGDQVWEKNMSFQLFSEITMPVIRETDEKFLDLLAHEEEPEAQKRKKTPKQATDLLICGEKKSPYPLYRNFLQSDRFSLTALYHFLFLFCDCDLQLKSSRRDPRLILEEAVFHICHN